MKLSFVNAQVQVEKRGASFLLFMFRVCHAFLSVHCRLVVTCWERAGLIDLLCVMLSFYCFCHCPMYLVVSIPDLCFLPDFQYQINFNIKRQFCGIYLTYHLFKIMIINNEEVSYS